MGEERPVPFILFRSEVNEVYARGSADNAPPMRVAGRAPLIHGVVYAWKLISFAGDMQRRAESGDIFPRAEVAVYSITSFLSWARVERRIAK